MDFRSVLFNHHIDTLCLHWLFTAELARYGAHNLGYLRHVVVLVERRSVNLNRYAPLHFIEFCLRCERLESFRAVLACLPDGAGTSSEEDKLATMKLERSLMRVGELWE